MGIGLLEKNKDCEDNRNCLTKFKETFNCKNKRLCDKDNRKKCTRKCFGLNSIIIIKTIIGWVLTLLVVGVFTGLLVAQGVYSPCPGYIYYTPYNSTNFTNFTN